METNTVTNHDVGANGDIRAYSAVVSNLSGGVNQHVATVDVGLGRGGQLLAALLCEGGEVQAGSAQEILGLTDVHPEALEVEGVELVVLDHGREGFLLNGGGTEFNSLQNRGVEDVHASIDTVADELNGLLDESVDTRGMVGLVNDNTVLGGLFDLGHHNGSLVAVVLVELQQLLEGVVADDIGVEDKEWRVVLQQDLLGKLQGTGGVEGFGLDGELDVDVILLFVLKNWRVRFQGVQIN